ncbi:MAG: hypothetical protein H7Y59_07300 [Anaerolineales bacterium]|nr:hypothetical protein [Anaerolineales bacterium]
MPSTKPSTTSDVVVVLGAIEEGIFIHHITNPPQLHPSVGECLFHPVGGDANV